MTRKERKLLEEELDYLFNQMMIARASHSSEEYFKTRYHYLGFIIEHIGYDIIKEDGQTQKKRKAKL